MFQNITNFLTTEITLKDCDKQYILSYNIHVSSNMYYKCGYFRWGKFCNCVTTTLRVVAIIML